MIEFHLDPRSGVAPYLQIVQQVKEALRLGLLDVGDQLPTVREVVAELAINPNTVARAYEALERDGVIVRRQGSGCFVTGETSALRLEERRKRLDQLVQRAVTEAFHLGLDGEDVRAAIERHLKRQAVPGGKG